MRLKARQIIYEAGDEPGGLFGVVQGHAELHMPLRGLESTLTYIGGPGFWMGDAAAVAGYRRLISVRASSNCQVFRLARLELHRLATSNPIVWSYMAMLLAKNLATALCLIDALKRNDTVSRVAATLANLMKDLPKGKSVLNVSQAEIASMAHLGRGSVNAALKNLQTRGWIRIRYGSIELTSASGLRRFAGLLV